MGFQEYLNMMRTIQEIILNFLEDEAKSEENLLILRNKLINLKISDSKYDLLSLLHLISKIGNNYHRFPIFFNKIEKILQLFKEDIKKYFSNSEIFTIFKSNKRILLFLIEQQIVVVDEFIVRKITKTDKYIKAKYPQYFQSEIQSFINEKWFPKYDPKDKKLKRNIWVEELKKGLPENFYEKRKEGENDSQICELIRKDMIAEFVKYITLSNVSLNANIPPSIYETNSLLLKKQTESYQNQGLTLIEYAAFFGSIKILNFLRFKDVELKQSLWTLAIHSQNVKIIQFLEENFVELNDKPYKNVFYESIKCHHNDLANYFISNFLQNDEENAQDTINQCLKYYNFTFLTNESISKSSFSNLCKYDYYLLVDNLMKDKDIDVNQKEIFSIMLI